MNKLMLFAVYCSVFIFFTSCTTSAYRPLSEIPDHKVIGNIQTTFETDILETIVRGETVYIILLEAAKKEYYGNIDIRDITWSKNKTIQDPNTYILLGYEYLASGKVILLDDSGYNTRTGIEGALARASGQIMSSIQPNSIIAIVYFFSTETDTTEFITNELEYIMVNDGFTIVDRNQLDKIRQEQNFQLSGEVDDDTAVSIGKIAGANIIITGSITGADETKRLRLRALNTETAQVMAAASERL